MANTTLEEKRIWRSGAYWVPVVLAVFAAHAESFVTYSLSNDDMWAKEDYLFMGARQARPFFEFLDLRYQQEGFLPQPFWNVAGMIMYVAALTVLCDFWKRLGKGRLSDFSLGFFTALFVSCPLTHEMLIFGGPFRMGICLLLCTGGGFGFAGCLPTGGRSNTCWVRRSVWRS